MANQMTETVPTLKTYNSLEELLLDKDLAALGDAYINFVYSLAMSQRHGHPTGAKVKNDVLASAVDKSGLRKLLPHRVDKHAKGDAAEALLIFAWLRDIHEFEDCIKVLGKEQDLTKAFAVLLRDALERLGVEHGHKKEQARH